jgi:hypothetical protein
MVSSFKRLKVDRRKSLPLDLGVNVRRVAEAAPAPESKFNVNNVHN